MRLIPAFIPHAALRKACFAWMAATFSTLAMAQVVATDPDWKEDSAPPAPAFEIKRLVPFEVSANSPLQWGFDPQTMTIGKDDIVRYVVVAQSPSGVVNAMYEAIRCGTGEWKTYARFNQDSGWTNVSDPKWLALSGGPSPHAARLARQGVCTGNAAASSVREIVQSVRQPVGAQRDTGNKF
jgi:CNP1-like family